MTTMFLAFFQQSSVHRTVQQAIFSSLEKAISYCQSHPAPIAKSPSDIDIWLIQEFEVDSMNDKQNIIFFNANGKPLI